MYQQQRFDNSYVLGTLMQDVEESFLNLGLSGEQEKALMDLFIIAEKKSDQVFERGEESKVIFDQITLELKNLLE